MKRLAFTLPLILAATGCIIIEDDVRRGDDPPEDTNPPVDDDEPCEGDEIFGDAEDSNCDDIADFQIDVINVPPGAAPMGWQWDEDLRRVGGVMQTETGRVVGHTLVLGEVVASGLEKAGDPLTPEGAGMHYGH